LNPKSADSGGFTVPVVQVPKGEKIALKTVFCLRFSCCFFRRTPSQKNGGVFRPAATLKFFT